MLELTFFGAAVTGSLRAEIGLGILVLDLCSEPDVVTAAELVQQLPVARRSPGMAYFLDLQQAQLAATAVHSPRRLKVAAAGRVVAAAAGDKRQEPLWLPAGLASDQATVEYCKAVAPSADGSTWCRGGLDNGGNRDVDWGPSLADVTGRLDLQWQALSPGAALATPGVKGLLANTLSPTVDMEGWKTAEQEDFVAALRAAANCSDLRRRSPLHVFAARGEPEATAGLLALGASAVGVRDSGGATALFIAAEGGHARICKVLLRGGAAVLAMNRAGETPLYIAALKGFSSVVEVLLAHCQEYGIEWQDAAAYGDGWTPLMAAAVADRQHVAFLLLQAAGARLSPGPQCSNGDFRDGQPWSASHALGDLESGDCNVVDTKRAAALGDSGHDSGMLERSPAFYHPPMLLNMRNRYGQTALHVAARRGSAWFVEVLLLAGASNALEDNYGMRAVDVALRHGHAVVAQLLWAADCGTGVDVVCDTGIRAGSEDGPPASSRGQGGRRRRAKAQHTDCAAAAPTPARGSDASAPLAHGRLARSRRGPTGHGGSSKAAVPDDILRA
eukprot:SM000022S07202  [mRNA]  locus=s22:557580:559965:+ [translate_table: standard]